MSTSEHMRQPGVEMFGQYFGDDRELYLSYDQLIYSTGNWHRQYWAWYLYGCTQLISS